MIYHILLYLQYLAEQSLNLLWCRPYPPSSQQPQIILGTGVDSDPPIIIIIILIIILIIISVIITTITIIIIMITVSTLAVMIW